MAGVGWIEERDSLAVGRAGLRWRRSDGAVVKYSMGPCKLEWIAYEPDPSEAYLIRYSKRGSGWPRRWKSAQAAMRALDKEFPFTGASP